MEEESKLKREIIRISGLKKIYKMGNQQVNALNGADLVIVFAEAMLLLLIYINYERE